MTKSTTERSYRRYINTAAAVFTFGAILAPPVRRALRSVLSHVVDFVMRTRSRPYESVGEGATVVFAPHPDDEAFGCPDFIALRRRNGTKVAIVYVTDGGASHPAHPRLQPEDIASMRKEEARNAMRLLGIEEGDLHFLGVADGTLDKLGAAVVNDTIHSMRRLLNETQPVEILLPYSRDGSTEHDAAYLLVMEALNGTGLRPRILEFPIWSRWNPLLLIRPLFTRGKMWRIELGDARSVRREVIASYVSQVAPTAPWKEAVLTSDFVSRFTEADEFFFEFDQIVADQ